MNNPSEILSAFLKGKKPPFLLWIKEKVLILHRFSHDAEV